MTFAKSPRLRAVLVFVAGAVAGALAGITAAAAVTGSLRASARQHNPRYTGEGLEYVAISVTYAGTALGGGLALLCWRCAPGGFAGSARFRDPDGR